MKVFSLKVALSHMCAGKLMDKLRCKLLFRESVELKSQYCLICLYKRYDNHHLPYVTSRFDLIDNDFIL